jgi:hypothetical protein
MPTRPISHPCSNNNSLESLQAAKVDTDFGKLQRMLKMLHMSVLDLKQGKESASEEEVSAYVWICAHARCKVLTRLHVLLPAGL